MKGEELTSLIQKLKSLDTARIQQTLPTPYNPQDELDRTNSTCNEIHRLAHELFFETSPNVLTSGPPCGSCFKYKKALESSIAFIEDNLIPATREFINVVDMSFQTKTPEAPQPVTKSSKQLSDSNMFSVLALSRTQVASTEWASYYDETLMQPIVSLDSEMNDQEELVQQLRSQLHEANAEKDDLLEELDAMKLEMRNCFHSLTQSIKSLSISHQEISENVESADIAHRLPVTWHPAVIKVGSQDPTPMTSEVLYRNAYFPDRGVDMVWSALHTWFLNEFGAGEEEDFKTAFESKVVNLIRNPTVFASKANPTARAVYLTKCLKLDIKPNSGILRFLSPIPLSDAQITTLDLASNYLGDHGVLALVPLFPLLPNLTQLNLSNNGLRNGGVYEVIQALKKHPPLTYLDLSSNKFTRVAGRELLGLITLNPNLKVILVEKTGVDDALKARIQKRLKSVRVVTGKM
eukprot:PhF_6_TR38964/c0_g1_i1/m.58304